MRSKKWGGYSRPALGLILAAAIAAIGLFLAFAEYAQSRAEVQARLEEDFRFDAFQRIELVKWVLEGCRDAFDSVARFVAASGVAGAEELESFVRPWIESGHFEGFAWLGRDATARFAESGILEEGPSVLAVPARFGAGLLASAEARSAARRAVALAGRAGPAAAQEEGFAVPVSRPWDESGVAIAAPLPGGGCLLAFSSSMSAIERAIDDSPPAGLPTGLYEVAPGSPPRLLAFHSPRLDALLGEPVLAPDPEARLSSEERFGFFGLALIARVEASPAYLARRRSSLPVLLLALGSCLTLAMAHFARRLVSRSARAEAVADANARELARYFALGRDLYCIADEKGRLRRVNAEWARALGFAPASLIGRPFLSLVAPEDRAATKEAMRRLVRGADVDGFAHRVRTAGGGLRWLEWRAAADPRSRLAYAAARDVTEHVESEAALKASIREKEALIREIHHRVKNNMQVISSLVSIESRAAGSSGAEESRRRILGLVRAMSMVHEAVYCSTGIESVSMKPYIRDLVSAEASIAPAPGVRIEFRLGDAALDLERATLCGLAADELVAGSLRRAAGAARDAGEGPELLVEGGERPGGGFWLAVRDNGAEPPGPGDGVGLHLVEALVAQMDGELLVAGSRAEIRLPPGQ